MWLVGFLSDEDFDSFELGAKFVSIYVPQAYNEIGQLYLVNVSRSAPSGIFRLRT